MDGKHTEIVCPPNSGSEYFNYKWFFSTVLFAVDNAQYQFLYVHVGCQGRIFDGEVFRNTAFEKALLDCSMNLPQPEPLPGREMHTPYVFLADDAFPLTENICKPYSTDLNIGFPKRVCTYRLSRARKIVDNVFGILASVFRVLHTKIDINLDHVKCIAMACCYLHNFMRRNTKSRSHCSPSASFDFDDVNTETMVPGSWRKTAGLQSRGGNRSTRSKLGCSRISQELQISGRVLCVFENSRSEHLGLIGSRYRKKGVRRSKPRRNALDNWRSLL